MKLGKKGVKRVETVKTSEMSNNHELEDEELNQEEDDGSDVSEGSAEGDMDGDSAGDDDNDGTPTEAAIEKDEPTIPSKVKSGLIGPDVPHEHIIHVNKLPKKCKVIDIVEVFAEYGPIDTIHIQECTADSTANIAFKNAKAARSALSANNKSTIKGSTLLVTMKQTSSKKQIIQQAKSNINESRERCVYVKFLKRGTTEDQLKEHFSSCGDIEYVRVVLKNSVTYAFVTFLDKATITNALKLHNSVLNGNTIGVFENSSEAVSKFAKRDPTLTIMLKNTQNLECVEGQKLQSIFAKCGEIENMDVVCKKNSLAFITFKTKEAVDKAFKLSGKTLKDIAVEVVAYNPDKPKTSIFITNLAKDVTEDDLKEHFSTSGDISAVILKKGFAIIHFKDSDGYCKSFLLNETMLKGQMIFLEPHSVKKQAILKSKYNPGKKRPAHVRDSAFDAKRVKTA